MGALFPLLAILLLGAIGYSGRTLVGAVVRSGEISPQMPVSHDTFVYLCSLEVNEQNIAIEAFDQWREHPLYRSKWGAGNVILGELGPKGHGKDQAIPAALVSSKGCSYRSNFNVGYTTGATDYREGID